LPQREKEETEEDAPRSTQRTQRKTARQGEKQKGGKEARTPRDSTHADPLLLFFPISSLGSLG
jgi:hypothetical protein